MRKLALGLCFVLLVSGCAMNGGVRVEGAASQVKPPPTTPPPPSGTTPSVDAVALLRADPKVSDKIKNTLTPCLQGRYPVDARYVDVTRDGVADLLVSVTVCELKVDADKALATYMEVARGDGFVASYIYDLAAKPPVDVFALEEPGTTTELDDGVLQVRRLEYQARDKPCCPSQEVYKIYRWTGTAFELIKR